MTRYQRIFGTGPRGLMLSLATLGCAAALTRRFGPFPIHGSDFVGRLALGVSLVATLAVAGWSVKSLPPIDRGTTLVTSGAFKYFRHPLYASFLTFFNFGLAVYVDDWMFLGWALAQQPIWHWNMRGEERLMLAAFGEEYDSYCARTGRFVPRFWQRHSPG